MSGWAGYLEHWRQQLSNISRRVDRLLYKNDRRCVGICWQQNTIYYALAERQGETVRLLQLAQERLPSSRQGAAGSPTTSWDLDGGETDVQDILGRIIMGLARQGWQSENIICCWPADRTRCFLLDLPRQLTEAERREAAYWEVDGRLLEEGISADDFCLGWHLPEQGRAFVMAVPSAEVSGFKQHGKRAGLRVSGYVMGIPDGLAEVAADAFILQETLPEGSAGLCEQDISGAGGAAGAALWGLGRSSPLVLGLSLQEGAQGPQLAWRRLAVAAAALTLVVLFLWGGVLGVEAWRARETLQAERQQLLALTPDRKAMQLLEAARQETMARDAALQHLGEDAVPWYSILLYLGSPPLTVEGICLQDLKLGRDQSLELSGTALTYAALSEYMEAFRQEALPFGTPLLEKAERQEGNGDMGIRFRLVLKL